MGNVWKLYRNSEIIPEKGFIVDSIENYLSTLNTLTIQETESTPAPQYIKHGLNLIVKIDRLQSFLNFFSSGSNYNYMSIQNTEDTYPVYYFILKLTWTSQNTVALTLKMDTVNTFTTGRNSFTISDRTLVNREHKDRFVRYGSEIEIPTIGVEPTSKTRGFGIQWIVTWNLYIGDSIGKTLDFSTARIISANYDTVYVRPGECSNDPLTGMVTLSLAILSALEPININVKVGVLDDVITAYRKIDLYSEGLTPVLYKNPTEYKIQQHNRDWYLIYRNRNDISTSAYNQVNPVDCFIIANNQIAIAYEPSSNVINAEALEEGKFYIVRARGWTASASAITIEDNDGNEYQAYCVDNAGASFNFNQVICFYRTGIHIKVAELRGRQNDSYEAKVPNFTTCNYITTTEAPLIVGVADEMLYTINENTYDAICSETQMTLVTTSVTISGINDINRTDSKIIKIIKLPYCPANVTVSNNVFNFNRTIYEFYQVTDEGFEFSAIRLKKNNQQFVSLITSSIDNPLKPIYDISFSGKTTSSLKNIDYESKLYHSDYYQPKFIYDSFGFIFKLEYADPISNKTKEQYFKLFFKPTSTINSKFLFDFAPVYDCKYSVDDYETILPVARNNEEVLYNSQYINYLRTGYNYDVKSKNREEATSILGTAFSLVGTMVSFASTPVTGGIGIATGVSMATSSVMSVVNTANKIAQNEQNIVAKQAQLKNQAVTVSGSDDVDLMSYYTSNRGKLVLYELSPKMKEAMFDVFYYTGYVSGEMKVPQVNTRVWFNFLSCDLELETVVKMPDDCLQDLKDCYKNGVSFMHKYNNAWDFNRTKENWEISLHIPD